MVPNSSQFRYRRAPALIGGAPSRLDLANRQGERYEGSRSGQVLTLIILPPGGRAPIGGGRAGAIVMYDRLISRGRFAERPLSPRAPPEALPEHVHGGPVIRSRGGNKETRG